MALPAERPALVVLAHSLAAHLQTQQSLHRVRDITVRANCVRLVLAGSCEKFYHKQLAQELARMFLAGRAAIRNDISVGKESALTAASDKDEN